MAPGIPFARRFCVAIALVGTVASAAHADALKVKYLTRVSQGQKPKVRLEIGEPLGRLSVRLERDDGQPFFGSWTLLKPGDARELELGGEPGTRKYTGTITIENAGSSRESTLSLEAVVAPQLALDVDRSRVDLRARRLEARLSRPAARVELAVLGAGGATLANVDQRVQAGANEPIAVSWPAVSGDVARLDLKVTDVDGFFASVSLAPWSVSIPHEEVTFATDSADIAAGERPKLDASLGLINDAIAKHRELGAITLYVAGHTDTVGDAAYNLKLSQARARSIASYFRARGLRVPIAYEGFGEHAPVVATRDGVDEPKNRRVDYILGLDEPALKATACRPAWKRIK